MSRADAPDDIRPLLDDLQETLSALQTELDEDASGRSTGRPPRPPSPGDLLRFTEEYTIPTLVSLLEATIRSLELLRGVIRLVDPERSRPRAPDATGRRVIDGASTALSELRRALEEANLPQEGEARDIVEDARELSAELERRIDDAGRERGSARDDDPISIDVRESDEGPDADEGSDGGSDGGVDVESELDSIRESVREEGSDRAESDEGT
jgi:hypothetical protein